MNSDYPITSPEHAFLAGQVFGIAMRHGVDLVPEVDADGNYLASALLRHEYPNLTIRIVIPPPELEDDEA